MRRLITLLTTLMATVVVCAPAGAQSLDEARKQAARLESQILAEETRAAQLQNQLRRLGAQVSSEQGDLLEIRTGLEQTKAKVSDATVHLSELEDQLHTRARSLYKRGPVQLIGVLLGGRTIGEFVQRVRYASSVARRDEQLVLDMRTEKAKLEKLRDYQVRLERDQRATVETLQRRRDEITSVFSEQQATLAKLARARGEALALVASLEAKLGNLASLRRVAGRGMTISYHQWAQSFLGSIGAPIVRSNLVAVVAWEASEGTQATWNPLATTMPMDGATVYNSHGVRNYESKEQGLEATKRTLALGGHGYEAILDALERGAEAMETGRAINRSDWCAGCAGGSYVVGIIPAVEKYYDRYSGE